MNESEFKRQLVKQLLDEGGYARRLEDKYAVGTLDLLLVTRGHVIYAEAKILRGIYALPASVTQRKEIERFNKVRNSHAYAFVIGYKDGSVGFGMPGEGYDKHYVIPWPLLGPRSLTDHLNQAIGAVFAEEPV